MRCPQAVSERRRRAARLQSLSFDGFRSRKEASTANGMGTSQQSWIGNMMEGDCRRGWIGQDRAFLPTTSTWMTFFVKASPGRKSRRDDSAGVIIPQGTYLMTRPRTSFRHEDQSPF